ncbi:MAG: hypothetical protein U9P14_05935 [Gemmatimonadota bacterium]|nr:hypothetical protein [Gemmatimonadota bacterium]
MADRRNNSSGKRKNSLVKRAMAGELAGFAIVILVVWANEIFDLPHRLLGAPATPVNWMECISETIIILILLCFVLYFSYRALKKIKYLEGFLPVCSFCKRIRVGEQWIPIEEYIRDNSEAEFTHGLCPECVEKYYKEFLDKDNRSTLGGEEQ